MDEKTKRRVLCAREKGASSWFSSLPLKKYGYAINKQEISNGICVRCSWSIQNRPIFCACGTRNNVDHILTCKKGGYVSMRHNALRDTETKLLMKVYCDVKTEQESLLTGSGVVSGNRADKARLGIS